MRIGWEGLNQKTHALAASRFAVSAADIIVVIATLLQSLPHLATTVQPDLSLT